MKYIRKIAGLLIAVIFLASLIIGFGVIFALKNVNITLETYKFSQTGVQDQNSEEYAEFIEENARLKQFVLQKYRGSLLMAIDGEEVASCFENSGYVLTDVTKQYPCTLNIALKERREVFTVETSEGVFSTYDDTGLLLRSGLTQEEAVNRIDGAANIIVTAYGNNGSVSAPTDGEISVAAYLCGLFGTEFGGLRTLLKSVHVNTAGKFTEFELKCGVTVHISEHSVMAAEKMRAAKTAFFKLSGEDKTTGRITAVSDGDEVGAAYKKD